MSISYTLMYDWATIVGQLLIGEPDGRPYKIGGMYIEFSNSGSPVSAPTVTRDATASYYAGLSNPQDYLRVPLSAAKLTSSNLTNYPGGNITTFYAQTAGTTGVHGRAFNDSGPSRVFGGAIIATPDFDDPTQDLILVRFYFPSGEQIVKVAGSQITVTAPITWN